MDFETTLRVLDEGDSDAIAVEIARLTEIIKAGEEAQKDRAALMRSAYGRDPQRWSQTWLAQQAGVSQAAVSKAIKTPGEKNLEQHTEPAYLVGRLLGVANRLGAHRPQRAVSSLDRLTDKFVEEKTPVTPETLRQLRRMIDGNLTDSEHHVPLKEALADINAKLPSLPTLPNDAQTRTRLLLGFDHQRAALMRN